MARRNRPSKSQVKDYLREQLCSCTNSWGEVNTTELAELAADHFEAYGSPPEYLIPEEYYDWAQDVADEDEDEDEDSDVSTNKVRCTVCDRWILPKDVIDHFDTPAHLDNLNEIQDG